jgi:hypothetical protein
MKKYILGTVVIGLFSVSSMNKAMEQKKRNPWDAFPGAEKATSESERSRIVLGLQPEQINDQDLIFKAFERGVEEYDSGRRNLRSLDDLEYKRFKFALVNKAYECLKK